MNCESCSEQLSEYLDDELSAELRKEVAGHLEQCGQCRAELRQYEKMNSLVAALPQCNPGTESLLRIKAAFQKPRPVEKRTEFGPVLDMDELASFLRVSNEVVGQYLDEIPSFELGGKLLFRRKSVEDWIAGKEMTLAKDMLASEVNMLIKT